jgi:hypothetical protein
MAKTPETILPYQELPKNMDYDFLRKEGIRYAQALSGNIWTDYNEHDPGVTILEQLCYALTELGYKTNFNIEVFLKESFKNKGNHTFFGADEIFPCQPYTITDYRKHVIYNIPEVKNLWLSPSTSNIVRGLYKVKLQLTDVDKTTIEKVKNKVRELLNESRNLCEDIDTIEVLHANKINLTANIEIDSAFMGEEILAQVMFELDAFINPSIKRYTLKQLLDEGKTYSEIFDGAAPKNGFIKDEDLKPLTTEIYTSRLSKIIMGIEGVLGVSDMIIFKDDVKVQGDLIPIDDNMFPILDMNLNIQENQPDPISISRSGLNYDLDYSTANHILTTLESDQGGNYESVIDITHEFETPNFSLAEFENYFSIQNHFPEIYGVGQLGVSARATLDTQGYTKQLKAYLLVFEQLMANYLTQLANVQQLFSLEESLETTYFYQKLTEKNVPNLDEIMVNQDIMEAELQKINLKYERFDERRAKFLDHLLARFNEKFPTQRLLNNYKNVLPQEYREEVKYEILQNKIDFLRNYVQISRERGQGFNYLKPMDENNLSGLSQRLSYLLNIKQPKGRISDIIENSRINIFTPRSDAEPTKKSFQLEEREIVFESLAEEHTTQFFSESESILEEVLTQGIFRRNYEIYHHEDTHTVLFKTGKNSRLELFQKDSAVAAKEYIDKIIKYLHQLNRDSEGFHVVEHTLLRPISKALYGLELLDENNQPILQQFNYQPLAIQELIAENLDKLGIAKEKYIIQAIEDGFEVILTEEKVNDKGEVTIENVAKYINKIDTAIEADEVIDNIIRFLKDNYEKGTDIFTLIQFPAAEQRPSYLEEKYYAFRMSIVLPKWCNRFNNEDFKQLFFQTLQANVPAHIRVDYHWMNFEDLMEFEIAYDFWLAEKQKAGENTVTVDTASYIIAHLLKLNTLLPDDANRENLIKDVALAKIDIGI